MRAARTLGHPALLLSLCVLTAFLMLVSFIRTENLQQTQTNIEESSAHPQLEGLLGDFNEITTTSLSELTNVHQMAAAELKSSVEANSNPPNANQEPTKLKNVNKVITELSAKLANTNQDVTEPNTGGVESAVLDETPQTASADKLDLAAPGDISFRVIILTMNRPKSLRRLLASIRNSVTVGNGGYKDVSVDIHIDGDNAETKSVANAWEWPKKTITKTMAGGLRAAWLGAWSKPRGHAIILEDDIELSPAWFGWLTKAWKVYGNRDDVAGISLQRQTLIPQKPSKQMEIVNGHRPFLYKLVGSIGFSPHPQRWNEFLEWIRTKDLETFDAHVEGLVTSDWYKKLDKKTMWTQLFIRFCDERGLFTLYVNLPKRSALAAHWREKGEHFRGGEGKDFALATAVTHDFPTNLVKYGWDGLRRTNAEHPKSVERPRKQRPVVAYASRLHTKHGVVLLQLLNEGYVEMTKSWICNVRRFGTVLPQTLFVTTNQTAYDALTAFDTTLSVVLEPYTAPKSMKYGQTTDYNYMLFRTKLITDLLDLNLTLWLTESGAVWLKDPTDIVLGTNGDLVTMSDDRPPRKMVQGGFQLLRPTDSTKRLWRRMRDALEAKMKVVSKQDIGDHGSEQLMLDRMIREDSELHVGWLDPHTFIPGLWYQDTSHHKKVPAPAVVLNNWIVGNDAKIKRAKEWKHWFLDEHAACTSERKTFNFNVVVALGDSISKAAFKRDCPLINAILASTTNRVSVAFERLNIVGYNSNPNQYAFFNGRLWDWVNDEKRLYSRDDHLGHLAQKLGFQTTMVTDHCNQKNRVKCSAAGYVLRTSPGCDPPAFQSGTEDYVCDGRHLTHEASVYAADFLMTKLAETKPVFGYWEQVKPAHPPFKQISLYDRYVSTLLSNGTNTIIVGYGDHGDHVSKGRTNAREHRNPMLWFSFPKSFADMHPDVISNLQANAKVLCSPLDLYPTMVSILTLAHGSTSQYRSTSPHQPLLGKRMPINRTCRDANISDVWCLDDETNEVLLSPPDQYLQNDPMVYQCDRRTLGPVARQYPGYDWNRDTPPERCRPNIDKDKTDFWSATTQYLQKLYFSSR